MLTTILLILASILCGFCGGILVYDAWAKYEQKQSRRINAIHRFSQAQENSTLNDT